MNHRPRGQYIKFYLTFVDTGTTHNLNSSGSGRPRSSRSDENISAVKTVIDANPKKSVRRISAELHLSKTSVHRILSQDLELFAYTLQIRQSLTEHDCAPRLTFAQWMVELLDATPDLLGRIWFSDESHFHLDGHVNKQNCRFWGSQKPE